MSTAHHASMNQAPPHPQKLPQSSISGAKPAPASGSPRIRSSTAAFASVFIAWYEAAARGELSAWLTTAEGALALLLLFDQFPRNVFRDTPRMYATDAMACEIAAAAVDAGHDHAVEAEMARFFYLPFGHSESLADQERAVALVRRLGEPDISHAERHCGIVRRFGRFPHRNPILGRAMTEEEQRFLDEGGFAG